MAPIERPAVPQRTEAEHVGWNPDNMKRHDAFSNLLLGMFAFHAAPVILIETGPTLLSVYLSNPVAWNEAGVATIAGAAGYAGDVPGTGGLAEAGAEVVGTKYSEVLPTQDWINPEKVAEYKNMLMNGEELSPINAYEQAGKIFIEDGHHRFAAYMGLGIKPPLIIRNTGGPVGYPNWLNTTYQISPLGH